MEEEHLVEVEVEEEHLVEVSGPHNTDCRAGRGQLEPALAHLPPRHLQQLHDTDLVLIRLASTCLFLHEEHGSGKMYLTKMSSMMISKISSHPNVITKLTASKIIENFLHICKLTFAN